MRPLRRIDIDPDLADRLELVARELGARGLSLQTIIAALLAERADYYESFAQGRANTVSETE